MLLELRPSARRRRTVAVTSGLVLAVFVMGGALGGGLAGALVALGIAAVGLGIGFVYLGRTRIVLTPSELAVTKLVGTRRLSLAEVSTVVRATLIPVRGPMVPTLFLRGADGRVLWRLSVVNFEVDDIDDLVRLLGRPCVVHDRPMTPAQLDREQPGLARLAERRPFTFAFAIGCGTVLLVLVIGTLTVFLSA